MVSRTKGTCEPDRIERPTTWTPLLARGGDDLFRRQADAVIGDFEAAFGGAHGDLLGAIGMAIEAGLADQEFDGRAQARARALRQRRGRLRAIAADVAVITRLTPVGARYSPKTCAQGLAPFAGGDARLGAGDRGLHDVAAFRGGGA